MFFFFYLLKKFRLPLSSKGGGGLNGTVIKNIIFFAASLNWINRKMRIWFTNLQTSYVRLRIIESTVTSNKSLIIVYYALKKNKTKKTPAFGQYQELWSKSFYNNSLYGFFLQCIKILLYNCEDYGKIIKFWNITTFLFFLKIYLRKPRITA